MDMAPRPSVRKTAMISAPSASDDTDHLKDGVKIYPTHVEDDDVELQPHHLLLLQHSPIPRPTKKPPVPILGTRRKTWNHDSSDTRNSSSTQIIARSTSSSLRKTRSEVSKSLGAAGDGKTDNSFPRLFRKLKSTPSKADGSAKPARLVILEDAESGNSSTKLEADKLSNESGIGSQIKLSSSGGGVISESLDTSFDKITNLMEQDIYGSDECQEKLILSSSGNVNGNECIDEEEADELDERSVEEEEIETEKKSYDIKEVTFPDKNLSKILQDAKVSPISDKKAVQTTTLAVKQPPRTAYIKRSAFYSDSNKSSQMKTSTNFIKPSPNISKPGSEFMKPSPCFAAPAASIPQPHELERHPASRDGLQSFVDLVMWRDVSRSAFVFGTGTFMIISSSYTQDLNISFISITSYLGLAYLALIFVFRSILNRGIIRVENDIIVGEEEAMWIVKLVLPYINEFFLSLRGLFSGDPATTMKLAVVLFVLARCGSSITIWKMTKLGFVGVFTVPKVVASYSVQFKTQCKFWSARLRDAWESCSHKKIVAGIILSVIWNLCSVVARIWTLFMVAVAFRYYQQVMAVDEEDGRKEDSQVKIYRR